MPTAFLRPSTIEEALDYLRKYAADARILAGGTDLAVRRPPCKALIDVTRMGLDRIDSDGGLRIGAATTLDTIEADRGIRERYPALADSARAVGSLPVRTMATLGGNICVASTFGDTVPALLVLGARVRLATLEGERWGHIDELVAGPGRKELGPGEILVEIGVPVPPRGSGAAFLKLRQQQVTNDGALVNAAAQIALSESGECVEAGIAVGAAGQGSARLVRAAASLAGKPVSANAILESARVAMAEACPVGDLRGSSEYKREITRIVVEKVLRQAWTRAREALGS